MRVVREAFTPELYTQMHAVVQEHNDEICAVHGDLNPYLEVYFFLEANGLLDTIVAWDDSGNVLGYLILCTDRHHHHADKIVGSQMALYVQKAYRGKGVSDQLLKKGEEVLIARGADSMVISCPAKRDLTKYYNTLGFIPMEHTFYKKLGE